MPREQLKKDPYRFDAGRLGQIEGVTLSYRSNYSRNQPLIRYFGGLPYALPPVGSYRFRKPRALPDYYRYGTVANPGRFTRSAAYCPQPAWMGNEGNPALWDEDCLQLNVYIPTGEKPTAGWPVFFCIHGGFLQWGTANMEPAAVASLMSETAFRAIIIMPAYRLNMFGFLTSSELAAEAQSLGESSGNNGFWDQRLALEWTAKNIDVFGGDPTNITVGGYSAGAHSTYQQLAHELYFVPDENAIIRRVIMWSNSPGVQPKTVEEHQKQFNEVLNALRIPQSLPAEEKLRHLRETPARDLVRIQHGLKMSEFRAVTDDAFVSKNVIVNINNGDFARRMKKRGIKLMNGECRDEHLLYRAWRTPSPTFDAVYMRLCADYPEGAVRKLLDHAIGKEHQLPGWARDWQECFGILYANMQVHDLERGFQNALVKGGLEPGKDILRYRFNWRASTASLPPSWGVTHSTDMEIWFWGQGKQLQDEEKEVLRPWNEAFARFVHGEDLDWGTRTVTDMKRLDANGNTDVWEDDRWQQGVDVWDLLTKNGAAGFLDWVKAKL
ncbi:putative esterase/lipase [Teratosphaeria destructans]|uniref:Carboxylic ester hydrolase n=1 Tax=Teratosphaeria destructans TaxID=418781 RepID=A0A9W7SWX5_9PEZI|nr:putative esterase/lipase [Teratosphaeria destructans]